MTFLLPISVLAFAGLCFCTFWSLPALLIGKAPSVASIFRAVSSSTLCSCGWVVMFWNYCVFKSLFQECLWLLTVSTLLIFFLQIPVDKHVGSRFPQLNFDVIEHFDMVDWAVRASRNQSNDRHWTRGTHHDGGDSNCQLPKFPCHTQTEVVKTVDRNCKMASSVNASLLDS